MNEQVYVKAKSKPSSVPSFTPVKNSLLQRKCACGGSLGITGECEGCRKKRLGIHRKLKINRPGDKYEQEADRVAELVMRSPAPMDVSSDVETPSESLFVPPIVYEVLRSPGQPLDPSSRAFMESRFGYDFSQVRVHTDAKAIESAHEVNALAYTVGQDIVFASAKSSIETEAGLKLLAHELTHVMQHNTLSSSISLQRSPIEVDEVVVTIPPARRARILRQAGWQQVNVIVTITDFQNRPMQGHRVFAEFKSPGVSPQTEGGDISGGAIIWSDVWLKPDGILRLLAIKNDEFAVVPEGITHYRLQERDPLRFKAVQKSREVTVTAKTSKEAAAKVGVKGKVGVDYKIIKVGGELSTEETRRRGTELALTWKVILPSDAFDVTQVL